MGGIQQSFLDYNRVILEAGHSPIPIIATKAKIAPKVPGRFLVLSNLFSYDIISILQLLYFIIAEKPVALILHGNRAINFAYLACKFLWKKPMLIGVAHNYSYKYLKKCDYVFSITEYLREFLAEKGIAKEKIFFMPNVIDIEGYNFNRPPEEAFGYPAFNSRYPELVSGSKKKMLKQVQHDDISLTENDEYSTTTIGCLARFVHKKGVDVLIKSISILSQKNIPTKLIIGGDGDEMPNIKKLIQDLKLENQVELIGWVENKEDFFDNIDIFCLPSLEEPFGIIVLEAMLSKTPIISTKTAGPLEILTDKKDALLVRIESPTEIADSIITYIENPDIAKSCTENAYLRVTQNYGIKNAVLLLQKYLNIIEHK